MISTEKVPSIRYLVARNLVIQLCSIHTCVLSKQGELLAFLLHYKYILKIHLIYIYHIYYFNILILISERKCNRVHNSPQVVSIFLAHLHLSAEFDIMLSL
jgi:hypothetical protein